MTEALYSKNDSCIESAIHGLGHWTLEVPHASQILNQWLRKPTTKSKALHDYAQEASTGYIQ